MEEARSMNIDYLGFEMLDLRFENSAPFKRKAQILNLKSNI
jgi:hypothetical protein